MSYSKKPNYHFKDKTNLGIDDTTTIEQAFALSVFSDIGASIDAYTKGEMDSSMSDKADKNDTYTNSSLCTIRIGGMLLIQTKWNKIDEVKACSTQEELNTLVI